jgi:hypothetical protein
MWKQGGAAAGEEKPAATRVCLANLVVVAEAGRCSDVLEVLGELSPMYPTRTIVLLLSRECGMGVQPMTAGQDAGARVDGQVSAGDSPWRDARATAVWASVSAICHVPQPGQPQVCCEQVVLYAMHAQAGDLHRTVLPLLEPDVPVMVWWTLDIAACDTLLGALIREAKRFILDAGLTGMAGLTPLLRYPGLRELGWYRIHRWRELLAGMFDECGPGPLRRIDEVLVELGDRGNTAIESPIWLIAFLAGQLDWERQPAPESERRTSSGSDPEPSSRDICFATFHFSREGGAPVRVVIRPAEGEGLVSVTIRNGVNAFEARRSGPDLRITAHEEHVCQVPRVVHLPRLHCSQALAAAMAGRAVDPAFARAAPLAASMAGEMTS